jgi:hypothetical protein
MASVSQKTRELFLTPIKWNVIDMVSRQPLVRGRAWYCVLTCVVVVVECVQFDIVDNNIKPWVVKQIQDYFGVVDEDLVSYIVKLVKQRASPLTILNEVRFSSRQSCSLFLCLLPHVFRCA